jgi:hypothetical protein
MGRRGPPPRPNEEKRRLGNPGKRPLPALSDIVALAPATETPPPLRPLGAVGLGLWERAWSCGARWISPQTDIELLQILCEQLDERAALRLDVLRGAWHERSALRDIDAQIVRALSLLGFTPADRSRLGVAEVQAQTTLQKLRTDAR